MIDTLTHSLPVRMRGIWTTLTQNYRVAKAASELADATNAEDQEAKHDVMVDAINAIYLTPSAHPADLRLKIEVMSAHDMFDGPWWCAQEALAMLAIDAERLLPYSREGAAAMTALTNDAALIAAWERYTVARAVFSVLPVGQCAEGEHHTPAELEQLAIIEPAEKEIAAALPTTLRGLEIKLWFALAQNINQSEVDVLCALREAERHFRESGELDWCDKIVFTTIQALRAQQAQQALELAA